MAGTAPPMLADTANIAARFHFWGFLRFEGYRFGTLPHSGPRFKSEMANVLYASYQHAITESVTWCCCLSTCLQYTFQMRGTNRCMDMGLRLRMKLGWLGSQSVRVRVQFPPHVDVVESHRNDGAIIKDRDSDQGDDRGGEVTRPVGIVIPWATVAVTHRTGLGREVRA